MAQNRQLLLLLFLGLSMLSRPTALGAENTGRDRLVFGGEVAAGQSFERPFGPGFRFLLTPQRYGWDIIIRDARENENLARLTPPLHFQPNPCEISGWHFRNRDNTGPNEAGDRNMNAPGRVREFIFSPVVGRTIQGPAAHQAPTPAEIRQISDFGRGRLTVVDSRLDDPEPGRQARFAWMRFEVNLSWPVAPKQAHPRKE